MNSKDALAPHLGPTSEVPYATATTASLAPSIATYVETEDEVRSRLEHTRLEASLDDYIELYEFAPIAYFTLTYDGRISEVNLTGVALLMGSGASNILQQEFVAFVSAEDKAHYDRFIAQAKSRSERHTSALTLRRRDGSVLHAQLDCMRLVDGQENVGLRMVVTDLTERKLAELEVETLAFSDSLTGLANRRLLVNRIQHAMVLCRRTQRHGALMFIDLDDFKTLNDTRGHAAGDLLLQQVATRLTGCVREGDTVARLGGDEFVLMLEDLSTQFEEAEAQATRIGRHVVDTLKSLYHLPLEEYRGSASIGMSLFSKHRESTSDLLRRADLALYQAKADGGGTLRAFEPQMEAVAKQRAELESDLKRALVDDQFLLYYQPQVDEMGHLTGAEALIRWQHPTHGMLFPCDFIPLAEKQGGMVLLGEWVLNTACAQLARWGRCSTTSSLTMAVNVSAQELCDPHFVDRVLEVIERSGSNPKRLMLEFTESLMLGSVEKTRCKMTALKEAGVRFSLDDFGIGYSTITYLKELPLDQLKVDQSFLQNVLTNGKDAAILNSILTLGNILGIEVVVEGVETAAQHNFLQAYGCRAYQGFLYGTPGPEC